MKKVCVKDIATACGCSVSTVSKTLNNTDRVGKETAEKIRKTAEEMGYRSSFSAHSLASKTRKIGVVLFSEPKDVRKLFESGIEEAMSLYIEFGIEYKYIFFTDINTLDFAKLSEEFSALIITPSFIKENTAKTLAKIAKKIPIVFLQSFPEIECKNISNITIDAQCTGRLAAEFLSLCSPSNQVAIISGFKDTWIHSNNIIGFKDFSKNSNLSVVEIEDCQDDMEKAYMVTQKILHTHPNIGGFFVTSYVSPAVGRCVLDNKSNAKIIGVDIFKDSASQLKQNKINALIFQNQKQQAVKAIEAIISVFRGITVDPIVSIKPELILQSNISLYENDII